MTSQVESLSVGYEDNASAAANTSAQAIRRVGEEALATEAKVTRASRSGAQLARAFGDAERLAARLTAATRPYRQALEDLERSELSLAEKERLRVSILAQQDAAVQRVTAQHEKLMAGLRASEAAATAQAAGMAAATAAAGSWSGAMASVYAAAGSVTTGINGTVHALQLLNADFRTGHAGFAEWSAAAKGLEASLRGVSAAQKAINDATGISRQTVNTATIGPLKHAVTGTAAPTGNTLGLVTGDASATAARLADLEAAFGEADKALDGYRASLGLVDVAQQRYEAGLDELQRTIRLAGVEEAEGARLLAAYAAAHDPAIKKAKDLATAQATAAKETEQAERAALAKMSADWDAAVREREADAAMIIAAERDAAAAVKQEETALRSLVGTLDRTFGAEERLTAQQRLLDRAHRDGVGGIKLSEDQHKALSAALKEQHDLATRSATSTKLAAHESLNLGYQLQDFVVQVGSGQGVITPLLQQAPQAVGAVGGVGRAVALMTSPIALATMGTLALGGAMAVVIARAVEVSAHTRRLSVDIQAMGNASGVSAGQLRAIETQLRQQGVSGDAAFAAARTLAGARGLPSSMLGDVASIGRNMAAGTDDVAESVKGLTDALSEGYAGIRKLDDQYNFLTVDERRQIETMARHGDQAGVLKTAIDALHRQFDGLHEKALSPAGAAMERLSAGYNRLLDSIASRPIVLKGLETLALLLDKTAGSIGEPTKAERIAGIRRELSDLDAQYSRLPEATSGIQANHEAIILRRIDLMQQLAKLEKESAANQSSQIRTGAPRTAGTSNARSGMPDPAAAKYVSEQAAAFEHLSEAMQGNAIQRTLAQADMRAEEEIRDRRLRGLAADEIRTIRHKEALLQLTVAVVDSNRAAAADVAGNELVARAYGVSSAAVREATLHQKAMAEAARGTIEPYDAIVARLRAVDDAQRAVQAAQYDQTLRQQAEDAERLASAWGRGAGAAREAALANEVLAEARKRGLDPERDAGEIGNIGAGVWARDQAQRTQQFAQMASEQRRAVELANAEFDMLGASNAERAKTVAMLQAANDLRDKGADLTDAGTRAYIEQAGELARVNSQLQDAAQNAGNIAQPIGSAFEDFLVGAEKAGDAVRTLGEDLKRIVVRMTITKPAETAVSGWLSSLMSGGVSVANDNRPTPANDPGGLDRLVSTVKGGLGSSSSNAMWVRMAAGSAALDIGAMASGGLMPVAIKDGGDVADLIRSEARAQGVPEEVALAIGRIESGLQQYRADGSVLRSSAGAMGVMQLMPGTAQWLGVDASDTRENVRGGIKYLAMLGRQFGGDWSQVAGAYNAGPGRMTQYLQQGRTLPAETVTYIEKFGSSVQTANAAVVGLAAPVQSMAMAQTAQVRAQQAGATATQALTEGQQDAVSAALAAVRGMDAVRGTAEDVDVRWSAVSDSSTTAVQKMADAQRRAADTMAGGAAVFASGAQQAGAYMVSGSQQAMGALISIIGAASGIQGGGIPGQVVQAGGPQGIASSIQQLGGVLQKATGSDLFGGGSLGGIKEWLNTPLYGGSGAVLNTGAVQQTAASLGSGAREMASASMPLSGSPGAGGVTAGDALGAVGYGFNAFQNFRQGNTIGGIGNLAATAMMFIPGAQVFAPFVAIGSQLLGGLFGKDRGTPTAAATVTYSGTNQVASSYNQDNDGSLEQAQQLLSSIDAATKQFITAASGATNGEFGIGVEGRDGRFKARTLTGELPGDFGSLDEAVIAGFKANVSKGLISASDDVLKAIGTSTKTDINEWLGDVSFAKTFRPQFDSLMANLDPVSNQIKTFTEASKQLGEQVQANIVEWRDTASRLGLATEGELTTAARRGIEAMMGLGPVTQPLVGMAAATKQAEIQFEAFRPALASLGYTAEEVADMATRYTAKLTTAYSDAVGLLQRQGGVSVAALDGRGTSLSAADTFRAAGATVEAVTAPAFAALADGLDGLTAAARRGALTYADVEAGWRALNQAVYDGVLTADQYTTAVGLLTTAYQDSQTVLSTLRQGWTSVQAITEPHRQPTATDVLDGAMVRGGAEGVAGLRDQMDGFFGAVRAGTASFGDLAATYGQAANLYRAGTITGEQFTTVVQSLTTAWTDAANAAKALTAYQSDITSRMYTSVGASRTAGLLALDQQQAVELAQARDAGYDTTRLQEVQAAERGQKAFDLARADVLEWYDREIAAKQELVTSLQDGAIKIVQIAKQFQQAADSIRLSEDAPISPQERLAEAVRQWNVALGTVRSDAATDSEKETARSMLTQLGQTLVSIEKTNSAGTARTLYDEVLRVFGELGDVTGLGVDTADRQLQTANDSLKELQKARTEAANLGQRQLGSLDSIVSIMNQSYSLWQASLVPANQNTGTPTSATLDQMLKGLTKDTLGGIIEWAKAQGPETYQKALVAADTRLGWENNPYRYAAPADVATMDGTGFGIDDALGFLKQFGYTGQFDSNANAFIQSHGIGDQYTAFLRDFKARNSVEGKRTRLAAFTDAQIEAAFGGMADIQAVRAADPGFDLRRWFEQFGINEVLSGARHIPGFATGTLATPPGAVWVGERGPELMWQDGGAAVASSADSLRIAGIYASAVNDRWSATNVSDFRPAAPARPERGNGRDAAILAELRRLNDQIAELRKAVHDEEGSAQNQRGVLLTKLIKTVEALQAELAEQKPRLTA